MNKLRNKKKYHSVGTVPKWNQIVVEEAQLIPLIHTSLTPDYSIKSAGFRLVSWV